MRYRFFKRSRDLTLINWSKGHVWEPLTQVSTLPNLVSIHLLHVEICILFVKWPHKTTPLRCHAYLWKRAPRNISLLWKVWYSDSEEMKNASSKHEYYKYVLPLKNWVDWKTTRREKMSQSQKCRFWKKMPKNKKKQN